MKPLTKKNATIRTIAKLAEVSHTTVSRALNNSPLVKEATKRKIQNIARELSYVPNVNAKGLVGDKTFLIGIFFSDLETGTSASFFAEVIQEAKAVLPQEYTFSIDSIASQPPEGQSMLRHRYDGIVIISQSAEDDPFIQNVVNLHLPLVVLNRVIERCDIPNFASDDYKGAAKIIEYAVQMGHRRFAMIEGRPSFESSRHRKQAFLDVLHRHHLSASGKMIQPGNYLPKSGYQAMVQILSDGDVPTCIFCANDDMAVGAIRAALDLGYSVPGDVSFIGYDDMNYAKYLAPRLTTIRKPTKRIAQEGIRALTRILDGEETGICRPLLFEPTLIVRDSVADLRNH